MLSPLELIEKLAALVPPPRLNLIRYHDVLAPSARDRSKIVPAHPSPAARPARPPPVAPPRASPQHELDTLLEAAAA